MCVGPAAGADVGAWAAGNVSEINPTVLEAINAAMSVVFRMATRPFLVREGLGKNHMLSLSLWRPSLLSL
jgi:hypothetical protein